MAFKVGDEVKILDEDAEGVITELHSGNRVMVDVEGFEFEYAISNLIRVGEGNDLLHKADEQDFDHLITDHNTDTSKEVLLHIPLNIREKMSARGLPEIDLHIYRLVDKPQHLSNSEMIAIQTQRLEHFIQNCIEHSVSDFIIIHGVGQGVLRTEIRTLLVSHGNIEYKDADFREYGAGATHASIKGLYV